ncbi:MAG TPA: hypothetical protein VFT12_13000 [Thermoanaerobaculia bacterium]|nr:hypothetical protein [Thermoanaerobaculia bacterium]
MRSRTALLLAGLAALPAGAEYRVTIEPSVEATAVHDDNLNSADEDPLRDTIQRLSPALALRVDGSRLSARATYGADSETYAQHSQFDDSLARQQAALGITYDMSSRLTLSLEGSWVATNTLTDLNADTGIAGSRMPARRISGGPAAQFRVSPLTTAIASASTTRTAADNGDSIDASSQSLFVERRRSSRDVFTAGYEHSVYTFDGLARHHIDTHAVIGRWQRALGARTSFSLNAGPRLTSGASPSVDLSASIDHAWTSASVSAAVARNQATLIGYTGLVDTESVQVRFGWTASRRLTAFAAPAVFRSSHESLRGIVYRFSGGARYSITPLLDVQVSWNSDRQDGAIDPLRAGLSLSRSVLSLGFSTRWNREVISR